MVVQLAVVIINKVRAPHSFEMKLGPLSEGISSGTLNQLTQPGRFLIRPVYLLLQWVSL